MEEEEDDKEEDDLNEKEDEMNEGTKEEVVMEEKGEGYKNAFKIETNTKMFHVAV